MRAECVCVFLFVCVCLCVCVCVCVCAMCAVCCVCVCVLSADGECESSLMSSYDLRTSIGVLDTLMGMGLETNLQCAYMRVSIQQTIAEA